MHLRCGREYAENAAYLYIVVDTNILLSYKTSLERILELVSSEDMSSLKQSAGLPAFKVVIVVPYMVLVELDYIKNKKGGMVSNLSVVHGGMSAALHIIIILILVHDVVVGGAFMKCIV